MRILMSDEAHENISSIFEYISKDSVKYANETVNNIYAHINALSKFPHIGRFVAEIPDKAYRELQYKSYRIIYTISEEKQLIHILFIIHGKRDFNKFSNKYKIKK